MLLFIVKWMSKLLLMKECAATTIVKGKLFSLDVLLVWMHLMRAKAKLQHMHQVMSRAIVDMHQLDPTTMFLLFVMHSKRIHLMFATIRGPLQ